MIKFLLTGKMFSHISYPVASVVSKGCLGLIVSLVIANSLSAVQIVNYIQLLFAQSVFIAFISGVSFIRSVRKAELNAHSRKHSLGYFAFSLVTALLVFGAAFIWLPPDYLGISSSELTIVLAFLCLGGVASGVVAHLLGAVLQGFGARIAYFPGILLSLVAGAILLANLDTSGILQITVVVVLSQCGYVIVLLPKFIRLIDKEHTKGAAQEVSSSAEHLNTVLYGLANTVFLVVLLAVREYWHSSVDADFAAKVYIVLRISDLLLQVPYLLVATFAGKVRHTISFGMEDSYKRLRLWSYASLVLIFILLGAVSYSFRSMGGLGEWISVVIVQIGLDIFRGASMIALVLLISFSTAKRYALVMSSSAVIPLIIFCVPVLTAYDYTLYGYLASVSTVQILIGVVFLRRYSST